MTHRGWTTSSSVLLLIALAGGSLACSERSTPRGAGAGPGGTGDEGQRAEVLIDGSVSGEEIGGGSEGEVDVWGTDSAWDVAFSDGSRDDGTMDDTSGPGFDGQEFDGQPWTDGGVDAEWHQDSWADSGATGTDGGNTGSDGGLSDTGGWEPDSSEGDDATGGTAYTFCTAACTSPSDCASDEVETGAYGADNFLCVAGGCQYQGCFSDAECNASLGAGGSYVCRTQGKLSVCLKACATQANCATQEAPGGAFGEDNYTCIGGACVYAGCGSTQQCQKSYPPPGLQFVCEQVEGSNTMLCLQSCTTPSDCGYNDPPSGAYGSDNYTCIDGACHYQGCFTDAECQATFAAAQDDYVCRAPK